MTSPHDAGMAYGAAPFYSQLDAISPNQRRKEMTHAGQSGYSGYQSPMPRLDMSSIANALPDHGRKLIYPYDHHHDGHNSYVVPNDSPLASSFSPSDQMSPLGGSMPIYGHHPLTSASRPSYTSQNSSGYASYGPYQTFTPQAAMNPTSVHGMAGFPMQYPVHLAQPEGYQQMPMMPYPGAEFRPYMNMPMPMLHGDIAAPAYTVPDPTPSYPRGPPRKPKQSGHALWVGNLPPSTTITDLKDHFSREATKDIESLFLISKSNCAFVNYRSEVACNRAMARFHDSRFNGVRLVCRLRRGSAAVKPPTEDALDETKADLPTKEEAVSPSTEGPRSEVVIASGSNETSSVPQKNGDTESAAPPAPARVPERYFIVKSLTLQDLDASVCNGIWATQSHNEAALNQAFESAENVYLIFSANKSGEYFGYGRMTSQISDVPVRIHQQQHELHQTADVAEGPTDGPTSIVTPATEWAPPGRIVDDSARGTIFWEAEAVAAEGQAHSSEEQDTSGQTERGDTAGQSHDWGKPFKIEWVSTNRLPFYRTRGLRNPWNSNREVKIARDGTELEPSVGKRLVQMFHRPAMPVMPQGVMQAQFQRY